MSNNFKAGENDEAEHALRIAAKADIPEARALIEKVDARRFQEETIRLGLQVNHAISQRFRVIAMEKAVAASPPFVPDAHCQAKASYRGCSRKGPRPAARLVGDSIMLVGACFQHDEDITAAAGRDLLKQAADAAGIKVGYYTDTLDKLVPFAREHGVDLSYWQDGLAARGLA